MQRLVALKVSRDRGNEPQTLAQLDHPHIVRVFDQRQLAERKLRLLYMQYVAGGTLQGVVEQCARLPPAVRSGRSLFEAIDAVAGAARRVAAGRFDDALSAAERELARGRLLAWRPVGRRAGLRPLRAACCTAT